MRITLADPPAYTPAYDHALAAALARQGADVRLLTSRFRYGAVPAASGYVLDDSLYRVSSRIGPRALRLAAKGVEHPFALSRQALTDCDVLHLQWVAAPTVDAWLLHARRAPRLHGARPPAPAHGPSYADVEAPLRPLRPDRHAQRARAAALSSLRGARRQAARHSAPGHHSEPERAGRRPHGPRARRDQALQGPRRRRRGRARRR